MTSTGPTATTGPTAEIAPARGVPEECLVAARAADAKSGEEIVILDMGDLLGIAEAFVITNGRNSRQVKTIVDEVELQVKLASGRSPVRIEGLADATWVLMDYGDFLVHVFMDEARAYYDLEHLWSDAPRIPWAVPASA